MNTVISSYQLNGNNRCRKFREIGMNFQESATDVMDKSSVEKSVLLNGIFGKWNAKQVIDAIHEQYDELTFSTKFTRNIHERVAIMIINRYLSSERRTPISPNLVPRINMELKGLSSLVSIKPDVVFYDGDSIEVVKFKTGRPNITQSGSKRDASAEYCLELYALWCYGRNMAPREKSVTIKSSYYFLKRADDQYWATNSKNENFPRDFFQPGGKNIISLSEMIYKDDDGKYESGELDEHFAPIIEEFDLGDVACSGENCESCSMNAICNFKFSPIITSRKKGLKPLSTITLSKSQEDVIHFHKGIARCNAGAGAGKTLVVALHVVSLIMDQNVAPEHIVCLTYTNAGAGEMRGRIKTYLVDYGNESEVADKIIIKTFNAFCNDIVNEEYERLGFAERPRLIDDIEKAEIIANVVDKYHIDGMDYQNFGNMNVYTNGLAVAQKAFEIIKKEQLTKGDEDILKEKMLERGNAIGVSLTGLTQLFDAYEEYAQTLRVNNLIEFADQSILLFELLWQDRYYLEQFGFEHIIIDEFQDSNDEQLDLIREMQNTPSFKSLLVVGDDSQSIFSFQGANPKHIIEFFDEMGVEDKDQKEFFLLDNHRSTPNILRLANNINRLNESRVDKDLVSSRPEGAHPVIKGFHSRQSEFQYIVEEIKKKIAEGVNPEDIAFLGRSKANIQEMGSLLTEAGIQWVSMNPEPILNNSKVIAGIELAKAVNNPNSTKCIMVYLNAKLDNTLLTYTPNEINDMVEMEMRDLQAVSELDAYKKKEKFISMIKEFNYDEDELFNDFIETLDRYKTFEQLYDYIKALEKYGAKKEYKREKNYPGVVLTTSHSSKGLEWPVVFFSVSGFDTQACHTSTRHSKALVEETRRLVFVSITRAKDELYITGQFVAYGPKDNRTYNQFLRECFKCNGDKYDPIDHEAEQKAAEKAEAAKLAREERVKALNKIKETQDSEGFKQGELHELGA